MFCVRWQGSEWAGIHTNRSKPTGCKFVGFILVGIKPASVSRLAPCVVCAVVVGQLMSNDKSDLILRLRDPEKSCIGDQPRRIRLYGQNLRPANFTGDALVKPATCSRNNLLISDFTDDFKVTVIMLTIEPDDKGLNFIWLRQMNAFCILPSQRQSKATGWLQKLGAQNLWGKNQVSISTRILCYFNEKMKLLMYLTMVYVNTRKRSHFFHNLFWLTIHEYRTRKNRTWQPAPPDHEHVRKPLWNLRGSHVCPDVPGPYQPTFKDSHRGARGTTSHVDLALDRHQHHIHRGDRTFFLVCR